LAGAATDAWTVQVYGENLTNVITSVFNSNV